MIRPPPRSTLFPYTTLSRFVPGELVDHAHPHPMLGLRAAIKVLDVKRLLPGQGGEEIRLQRGEVRRADRFIIVPDRKSTRLNSSHLVISYAVFCLKKKNIYY